MITKQREAFSMITAIFVIVMMATVAAFIFNLSGKIIKETTNLYQKEQAVLLAKSYTELAIMTAMANDRNASDCVEDIDGHIGTGTAWKEGTGYLVETRIGYIGATDTTSSCAGTRQLDTPSGDELNIIVDVYVKYKDIGNPNLTSTVGSTPWITYHRRTLQKI